MKMKEEFDLIEKLSQPYYIKAKNFSPIEHSLIVRKYAEEIAEGEKLNDFDKKVLVISAILHDVGNCKCTSRKVVESEIDSVSDVEDKNKLVKMMIQAREEHSVHGQDIGARILTKVDTINTKEMFHIMSLIRRHDDHKVQLATNKPYLPDLEDKLLWLLREADALWMLTPEGISTDICRTANNGDVCMLPDEQIEYNINYHKKIYNLYTQFLGEKEIEKYNFKNQTMYRSETGYEIYKRLTDV